MSSPRHAEGVSDHGTDWKLILVFTLKAAQTILNESPITIPGAGTCISLVLTIIEAADTAADNQEVLNNLATRYDGLKNFLTSVNDNAQNIPTSIRKEMNDLEKDLEALAEKWKPLLLRPNRKRDWFKKLFSAQSERDKLKGFLTGIDDRIKTFLLHFEVHGWIESYRVIVQAREAASRAEEAALNGLAQTLTNKQITLLQAMPRAQSAAYNAFRTDPVTSCLEGTRHTVRTTVMNWALDPGQPPLFWLNGLAGIGKTTIAHTVATSLDRDGHLGGSFFFLRSDPELNNARLVFPTLASQLSEKNSVMKIRLAEVLEKDPGCVNQSLATQFDKLILDPMSAASKSCSQPLVQVVVLDALDECQPNHYTTEILQILVTNIKKIPFLRLLITSRPEVHISEGLSLKPEGSQSICETLNLHGHPDIQEEVTEDIRLYLKESLQGIWAKNNDGKWPPANDLETLVERSDRLFIYATTVVRFIGGNPVLDPTTQLMAFLKAVDGHLPPSSSTKQLDQLYLGILDPAIPTEVLNNPYYTERFQNVVGSIVLMQKPLPLEALARFLGYSVVEIKQTLYFLHSVIVIPDNPLQVVQPYHLSFRNFITSADRCTNINAHIDTKKLEIYLFHQCLYTMVNLYGRIHRSSINNESASVGIIDDPYDVATALTSGLELRYANSYWCSHLLNTPHENMDFEALKMFILRHHHHWLDWRIFLTMFTHGPIQMKLAQDTFDIMHNVYCWIDTHIDPQQHGDMKRLIMSDAHYAFARLFPWATGDSFTLGGNLDEQLTSDSGLYTVLFPGSKDVILHGTTFRFRDGRPRQLPIFKNMQDVTLNGVTIEYSRVD